MKDGKPESLAEALLLLEKMNARLSEKDQKIREQQAEIKILNEKLAVKRAREFASKTESLKKLYESQPFLFDVEEMGLKLENQCPEISDEDIVQALNDDDLFDRKSERKKPGRTRNKSKNLPRQKYVIDLSEEEKICSNCGTKMVKVREIVSERIVHVPSSEYIEEVHRYVYECQNCLDDNDKPVRKAAKEKRIIEHSIATPELLAHIFISKYMKHTPFYCLEDTYNWQGICISRQNMCNWSLKVHEKLKPLEELLLSELKKTKLLMFDESPVEVLKVDPEELKVEYWDEARYRKKADDLEEESRRNCYMWVVLGGTKEHPVFSYNFRWTRSGKNVLDFLEGYTGNVIQSDGYSGYNAAINYWNLSHPDHKIELLNCWVHARRGFADAVKATKSKHAAQAIKLFKDVFDNENRLRKLFDEEKISEAEFLKMREKEVKPHIDNLHTWLLEKKQKEMILDSSKTKEAVNYCLNRWENLENFIRYPEATFSTNAAERSVKSWVMARRNFLFSGSGNGARASCFILSLIETAKQNGIAPEDYLRCLFEKAPYAETENDWEKLLPWNIEITPYKIRGEWI